MAYRVKSNSRMTFFVFLILMLIQQWHAPSKAFSEQPPKAVSSIAIASESSNASETPMPDLFTGTMSYQIPIQVPPGRSGMQPEVLLSYNSRGDNGWLGMGWDLELGAIERSTRAGLDYTKDDFTLKRAGSASELVMVSSGEFRSKVESDFMRIQKQDDDSFVAYNKSGLRFFFGRSSTSRVAGASGTFRWSLDGIADLDGNQIDIIYQPGDNGQSYPDCINYNGNQIKFYVEDRPDAVSQYGAQFLIRTAKRLRAIGIVGADGKLVRAYQLKYKQGNHSNRSLLDEISLFGSTAAVDNGSISDATTIPIKLFKAPDYGDSDDNSYLTQAPSGIDASWAAGLPKQFIGDFNGDGRSDILALQTDDSNRVMLSNGDGSFSSFTPKDADGVQFTGWLAGSATVLVGDYDGDARTDLLIMKPDGTNNIYRYLADGKFEVISSPLGTAATWTEPAAKLVGDFDGDGKTDVLIWRNTGAAIDFLSTGGYQAKTGYIAPWTYATHLVGKFINNGKSNVLLLQTDGTNRLVTTDNGVFKVQTENTAGIGPDAAWGGGIASVDTGDFNGDGITDFVKSDFYSNDLYISKNDGSFAKSAVLKNRPYSFWSLYFVQSHVADLNGDGKSDILQLETYFDLHSGNQWTGSFIYLSNGDNTLSADTSNFGLVPIWTPLVFPSILTGDFIGNGKSSFLAWDAQHSLLFTRVKDTPLDTLKAFTDDKGGTVSIDYAASTTFANNRIPFPLWAPKVVITNDGNGNVSQETYAYEGGYLYPLQNDFRGFNHVTLTGPLGPNGERKVTETWFQQGDGLGQVNNPAVATGYMKGKPYRVRISDSNGHTYSETTTTYAADKDQTAPWFTPVAQVDTYLCDGGVTGQCEGAANARQSRTNYVYDVDYPTVPESREYGNLSYEYHYGDLSVTDDDLTISRSYSPNATSWILGLPMSENVYKGIGTANKIASKTNYYDGTTYNELNPCGTASTNQIPDKGHLTRVLNWLKYENEPEENVEVRMDYDSYGNQRCRRDPLGYNTTFSYDPSNTFLITTKNHLNQIFQTEYYGVNGVSADKGYYGQEKKAIDPNSSATTREYDAFGRILKETQSDNTWISWDYKVDGVIGSQRVRQDTSDGLWSESYFDGFGRTYLQKSKGPETKVIAKDTVYDARGAVQRSSFPYFFGQEVPRYHFYDYDSFGRVVRTEQETVAPEGIIRSLACYNKEAKVTIDPNNHRRREVRDAAGRLTKVQEYTGVFSSCTTEEGTPYATTRYEYDVLGNLRYVKDHNLNQTEMRYDSLGRKRYMSDPDMGAWTYTYDKNGNSLTQTDAESQVTSFTYDELNRLKTKRHGSTVVMTNTYDQVVAGYSNIGQLTTMTDTSGQAVLNYDNMGRVKSSAKTVDGTTYTIGSSYTNGRLQSITYPDNETVSYSYDAGNLKGITGYVTYSNFDAVGRPQNATFGTNGATSEFGYAPVTKRLARIRVSSPTEGLLFDKGYDEYDRKGNITKITDHLNTPLPFNATSETYIPGRPHAPASTGSGRLFSYDNNGNIKGDGSRTFTYNYDNKPTSVNNITFTYDGSGTRIKKSTPAMTTTYIDGLYECTKATGSTTSTCAKYIFAGNSRVALKSGSQTFFYHPDHQGSTSVVTDPAGHKVEQIAYYPFGGTRLEDGSIAVNHMYTGQELDAETGLYNYNARLYDPDLGRFMTPDAIVPDPEDPQSFNRYSYVRNNPANLIDPTGHAPATLEWSPEGGSQGGACASNEYCYGNTIFLQRDKPKPQPQPNSTKLTPEEQVQYSDAIEEWLNEKVVPGVVKGVREFGRAIRSAFGGRRHRNAAPPPPPSTRTNAGSSAGGLTGGVGFDAGYGLSGLFTGQAKSRGDGAYIGLNNGALEFGLFEYKSKSDRQAGVRAGLGGSITFYGTSARESFEGSSSYRSLTVLIWSGTEAYNSETGATTGYILGLGGRGYGFSGEYGTTEGKIVPLW